MGGCSGKYDTESVVPDKAPTLPDNQPPAENALTADLQEQEPIEPEEVGHQHGFVI